SLRLVSSHATCQGSVEVRSGEGWTPVCEEGFDPVAQQVVCRELGCGPPVGLSWSNVEGAGLALAKQLVCKGNESRAQDCDAPPFRGCKSAASIACSDSVVLRVVGGANRCEGTLEGTQRGEVRRLTDAWGRLTDETYGKICEQINCGNFISMTREFETERQPAWEPEEGRGGGGGGGGGGSLSFIRSRDISSTYFMFIKCSETVLLSQGYMRCSGSVQVRSGDLWSSVCMDSLDLWDQAVICRDLGCGVPESFSGYTDLESDWTNELECTGREERLLDCPSSNASISSCPGGRAYAKCTDRPPAPLLSLFPVVVHRSSDLRVSEGHRFIVSCQVDTQYSVLSFRLTAGKDRAQQVQTAANNTAYFLFPPADRGTHSGSFQCDYNYDYYPLIFSNPARSSLTVQEQADVALAGGGSSCAGTLELSHGEERRPVSYSASWSLKEAAVVCRQLRCGSVAFTAKGDSAAESRESWRFFSDCNGTESALMDCGSVVAWPPSDTLQVVCSDVLVHPNLTVHSVSAVYEEEEQLVQVLRGHVFSVNCSVEPQYPGGHFSLLFNQSLIQTQSARNHTARFLFPAAGHAHQGQYSCVYHNFVFDGNFSSESESVSVTVRDLAYVALEGGGGGCAGTLMLSVKDQSRPVCGQSAVWEMKHAAVACRQLDCGAAVSTTRVLLPDLQPMWRLLSDCDGSESALLDCGDLKPWVCSSVIEVECTGHQGADVQRKEE
ncbi:scavenger receptor cysteine-rich type 1 protein M130-like, partial [Genypterus blacodes]|uniref:scavenger receptor cysteine-rich type 1 protein M130-like n=1 Tax=Genypterus blacodes TaxID=154954 RepID=UPI003F76557A